MREIKIRYTVVRNNGHVFKEIFPLHDIENGYVKTWLTMNHVGKCSELHKDQNTGLQDRNGVDIYCGDIVECEYYPDLPTTKELDTLVWRGVVEWGADAAFHVIRIDTRGCYAVRYGGSAVKRWDVIGNIHENPELLEDT